jgi:hypothetical protein
LRLREVVPKGMLSLREVEVGEVLAVEAGSRHTSQVAGRTVLDFEEPGSQKARMDPPAHTDLVPWMQRLERRGLEVLARMWRLVVRMGQVLHFALG